MDPPPLSQAERAARALAQEPPPAEPLEIQLLAATLDYPATLRTVAGAFVPRFADWGFIHLLDEEGVPRRVKVAHADPAKAELAAQFQSLASGTLTGQAIRDRVPRLVREVNQDVLRWAAHDDRHLVALQALAPHSILVLPLLARDRVIGGVTLMRVAHIPGFTEADMVAAQELTVPAALALDNARRAAADRAARDGAAEKADVERHARVEAEKGILRLRRLQSVAGSLASALSPEAAGRILFENGLSLLCAKSGTLAIAGEAGLEIVQSYGWPPAALESWRTFGADAPSVLAEAFRTQTPLWIDSPEALSQTYPSAMELRETRGEQAWAALPLVADGRVLGVLGLGFCQPRHLDDSEREYAVAMAALVAQAIVRVQLRGEAAPRAS